MRTYSITAALFLSAVARLAAGPVYVRETATSLVLGNDYLERTISTGGAAGTTGFLNKITGNRYPVRGGEFEIRFILERVGYNFGNENPSVWTAASLRVAGQSVEDAAGGKRVVLHLARPGHSPEVDLFYELKPDDFFTRQWLTLRKPTEGTWFVDWVSVFKSEWGLAHFSLGGYGQPLLADDLFFGLEYPTGINRAEGARVNLGGRVGLNVSEEGFTSQPAVIGVAPAGLAHRQFLEYVDRMRVAPVRPYLLYNSWYDLQRLAMNHTNTLERVPELAKLLRRYGLHLDSFVLDDGWDDMQHLWAIDPARFPDGFRELAGALRGIGSELGMWFGPIGGYDQRSVRISTGRREGMEITSNGQYLCIAGKNYSRLLADTMLRYQKEYGVGYYKLDGVPFGCNEPDHGHPTGIYSDEADTRALIGMLEKLRAQDPKVFLNITTSIWLSPWWLRWADTVWMGGDDSGYLPSVPTLAPRQSAVSYKDSVLYDDFARHQAQFPISSLMTHGIIKGKYNMLGGNREFLDDFKDEVTHYYGVGNMMYEWYISPDILSPDEIEALGNTTRWAEANAHPLLDNSTMVLGDPAAREPYGYVHSSPEKSIVILRNPFVRPRTVSLKIGEPQGFRKTDAALLVEVMYPYREVRPGAVHFGDALTFDLGAYEQVVVELRPVTDRQVSVEGVRYSVGKAADGTPAIRVYAAAGATETARLSGPVAGPGETALRFGAPSGATLGASLEFSTPALHTAGAAGQPRTVHTTVSVRVPADFREAKLAFLLEPETEIRDIKADANDNGKPVTLTLENGGRGVWHWFFTNLSSGRHELELTFHVPAAPGSIHFSGWLLTRRALAGEDLRTPLAPGSQASLPAENLLPASSDVERGTHGLVEASIP
jgi:hypothetical protein